MLSCIAKIDNIKSKLTSETRLQQDNIEKFNTRQSIDERNNNSDYEEPCKRPKIDVGFCSPIHSVTHFFLFYFIFSLLSPFLLRCHKCCVFDTYSNSVKSQFAKEKKCNLLRKKSKKVIKTKEKKNKNNFLVYQTLISRKSVYVQLMHRKWTLYHEL